MARRHLQFAFDVGESETHRVAFRFDPLVGLLDITVDGRTVVSKLDTLSIRRIERFGFSVGRRERHDVLIEKVRRRVVGGLLPQECRAYVDGRLVGRFTNARRGAAVPASVRGRGQVGRGATGASGATSGPAPGPLPF